MKKSKYNKRTWLNSLESDSTGSIVTFDGIVTACDGEKLDWSFLEISDCRTKVRLHMTKDDSKEEFISKLKIINSDISKFIKHLELKNNIKNEKENNTIV